MANGKILAFGEILIRLEPNGYYKFIQTDDLSVSYTGAEANVCVSLATLGEQTEFVTVLPQSNISKVALSRLRMHGVGLNHIIYGGERMGLYYLERGASQRPSKVHYDRKYSSISTSVVEDYDWDAIFKGVCWFHFTGITAALSDAMPGICEEACKVAKKKGITISIDMNYRKNLWSGEEAAATMRKLVTYADVMIGGELDAEKTLGITSDQNLKVNGKLTNEGLADLAKRLHEAYGFGHIAFTMRTNLSASDNKWAAMLHDGKQAYFSKEYAIRLVDRVGGGDSFGAGLIYSLINKYKPQDAIDFAVAASCLKQTMELDFNLATVDEVKGLMEGDAFGQVQR